MLFRDNLSIYFFVLLGTVVSLRIFWRRKIYGLTVGKLVEKAFKGVIGVLLLVINVCCLVRAVYTVRRMYRLVRRSMIRPKQPEKAEVNARDRLSSLREAPFKTICAFLRPFEVFNLSETNRTCYRKATKNRIWVDKYKQLEEQLNKQGKGLSLAAKFLDLSKKVRIKEGLPEQIRDTEIGMFQVLTEELLETLKIILRMPLIPLKPLGVVFYPLQPAIEALIKYPLSTNSLRLLFEPYLFKREDSLTWESAHRNVFALLANTIVLVLSISVKILRVPLKLCFLGGAERNEQVRRTSFFFSLNSIFYLFFNLTFNFWFKTLLKYLIFKQFVPEFNIYSYSQNLPRPFNTIIALQSAIFHSAYIYPVQFSVSLCLSTLLGIVVSLAIISTNDSNQNYLNRHKLSKLVFADFAAHFTVIPIFLVVLPVIVSNWIFKLKTLKKVFVAATILQFAATTEFSLIGMLNAASLCGYCAGYRRSLLY